MASNGSLISSGSQDSEVSEEQKKGENHGAKEEKKKHPSGKTTFRKSRSWRKSACVRRSWRARCQRSILWVLEKNLPRSEDVSAQPSSWMTTCSLLRRIPLCRNWRAILSYSRGLGKAEQSWFVVLAHWGIHCHHHRLLYQRESCSQMGLYHLAE